MIFTRPFCLWGSRWAVQICSREDRLIQARRREEIEKREFCAAIADAEAQPGATAEGMPNFDRLPELDIDTYRAITEVFRRWCILKAEHEPRWSDADRRVLRQLDPDIWHSSLLYRMLYERKLPFVERPPVQYAYPDYAAAAERAPGG